MPLAASSELIWHTDRYSDGSALAWMLERVGWNLGVPTDMDASEAAVVWLVLATQFVGFASVALARLLERSSAQWASQLFFWMAFLLVGAATIVSLGYGSSAWLWSAATLPAMAVGATIDLRGDLSLDI